MTRRIDLKRIHTAHFGTMRAINRQIVLNYVRDRGPISRAEIARRTSLQRSTISEIVDTLLEEGLVEEVGAGASTGGRSEEHTSELQSRQYLVCRLLLEKKKKTTAQYTH